MTLTCPSYLQPPASPSNNNFRKGFGESTLSPGVLIARKGIDKASYATFPLDFEVVEEPPCFRECQQVAVLQKQAQVSK